MCTVQHGFKFCTCKETEGIEYLWYLTRYVGTNDIGIMGSIVGPSRGLGQGLTRENVLAVLNAGNGFDFDYTPADDDCFRINHRAKDSYAYMSFLYKEGQWSEGMNKPFVSETETLAIGKICPADKEA